VLSLHMSEVDSFRCVGFHFLGLYEQPVCACHLQTMIICL